MKKKKQSEERNRKVSSKLKKYRELHVIDKVIDVLLALTIVGGLTLFVVHLINPFEKANTLLIYFDVIFVGVLFVDLGRTFFKSKNFLDFTRHHWLDLVILSVTIVSLSSILYMGLGRVSWLLREEKVLQSAGKITQTGIFRRLFR